MEWFHLNLVWFVARNNVAVLSIDYCYQLTDNDNKNTKSYHSRQYSLNVLHKRAISGGIIPFKLLVSMIS